MPLSMKELKDKLDGNEMDLSMLALTTVPVKELAQPALRRATKLDLSCNALFAVPDALCDLNHLVHLDLSQNRLHALPLHIGRLTNLQHLDLYKNQLEELPVSLGRLKKLKWLDVKENPLGGELAKVAGDCLDAKQCQAAASRIVQHMGGIQSAMERERQKRLAYEREEAARAAADEERARMESKAARKAEKEKRKSQAKAQTPKAQSNGSSNGQGAHKSPKAKGQTKPAGRGLVMGLVCGLFRLLFSLAAFAGVVVLATAGLLYLNCNSAKGLYVRGTAPLCADLEGWASKGTPPKTDSVQKAAAGLRAELSDGAAWLASRDYAALAQQAWLTTRAKAVAAANWVQKDSVPWAQRFVRDFSKHAATASRWTAARANEALALSKHYGHQAYVQGQTLYARASEHVNAYLNPDSAPKATPKAAPKAAKTPKAA